MQCQEESSVLQSQGQDSRIHTLRNTLTCNIDFSQKQHGSRGNTTEQIARHGFSLSELSLQTRYFISSLLTSQLTPCFLPCWFFCTRQLFLWGIYGKSISTIQTTLSATLVWWHGGGGDMMGKSKENRYSCKIIIINAPVLERKYNKQSFTLTWIAIFYAWIWINSYAFSSSSSNN